jgi:hypothetical protein
MSKVFTDDTRRDILNRLTLRPALKPIARAVGVNPDTMFRWIRESMEPGAPTMEWLGRRDTFAAHVATARRMNAIVIDHQARDLAFGHTEPRYHDGHPVYRRDPQLEADAQGPVVDTADRSMPPVFDDPVAEPRGAAAGRIISVRPHRNF